MSENKIDFSIGVVPLHKNSLGEISTCLALHSLGHWAMPKGHPNPNEPEKETALRELWEETGINNISLDNKTFEEKYSFDIDGIHYDKTVKFFIGFTDEITTSTPKEFQREISKLRWLPISEAIDFATYPGTKKLLTEVKEYLIP